MYTPISTYRVQLNPSFKLADLAKIIDYLAKLGISTVYAAPFFTARAESVHGYDVTNPHLISPQIGTLAEFQALVETLQEKNIGWLQDIVPNHMAFDSSNAWLMDIFEKGKHSSYYTFFDIDWNHPDKELNGKVLAPFLGAEREEALQKREIYLEYTQRGFSVRYYDLDYPLAWTSYGKVLEFGTAFMENHKAGNAEVYNQFKHLVEEFKSVTSNFDTDFDANNCIHYKEMLHQYATSHNLFKEAIDAAMRAINYNPEALNAILDEQFFRLSYWRTTEKQINYRRFFTVNDLICLRMEDETVFEQYHQFIKTLVNQHLVQGLRIDHIDGLYNPTGYLENLRKLVGKDVYLVVEKILESEEALPDSWPIEGTSGYEFLSEVNQLLTEEKNKEQFDETYGHFIRTTKEYTDLVLEKKLFILKEKMGGELNNLLEKFRAIQPQHDEQNLKEALAVFLASFSVYRGYPTQFPFSEADIQVLELAVSNAEARAPQLSSEFQRIRSFYLSEHGSEAALAFIVRAQQFTGPLAAKGVEDTVFYLYNRLISHNEVGDSPQLFGTSAEAFHQRMQERLERTPLSINATATHDTKRGEDARMRINALSELPEEWTTAVFEWQHTNARHKQEANGKAVPDENDEYFIYQTLLGSFPVDGQVNEEFTQRLQDYLIKVVREAKANSDWSEPNEAYENGVTEFIEAILNDRSFIQAFMPLFEKVRQYGILYSLAQTLLKITAPGIPDMYQGTELWDLSFVDPDNRRFVDFEIRSNYLDEIEDRIHREKDPFIRELTTQNLDGKIKLFTLYQALQARKSVSQLFTQGEYLPLALSGPHQDHVIAFARKWENTWAIVVVPKSIVAISGEEAFGIGEDVWKGTAIILPEEAPDEWKNRLTDRRYAVRQPAPQYASQSDEAIVAGNESVAGKLLFLRELLENFPVALLLNE